MVLVTGGDRSVGQGTCIRFGGIRYIGGDELRITLGLNVSSRILATS